MTAVVTCTYDKVSKVQNAREDLIATGIPQEEIFVDEDIKQIKIMIPDETKPEVVEILNRHEPTLVN